MARLKVDDFYTTGTDLRAQARHVVSRGETVVRAIVARVERDAKALAPVDTGNLRSSIHTTVSATARSARGEVGTDVHYAPYVEYGTSRMAPQPFIGPASDRNEATFYAAIAQVAQLDL